MFYISPGVLMVLLLADCLIALITGVHGEEGEGDDDVPGVGEAAVDRHRVLEVPLVGQPRRPSQDPLCRNVTTSEPRRQVQQAHLAEWRVNWSIIPPRNEGSMNSWVEVFWVISEGSHSTHV